jgi:toxin-antitoxin system PIN domain toxin
VKVVDLNVLVYATDATSSRHVVAKTWLDRAMSSTETIGVATAVAVGYVRITTNPRIVANPLDVATSVGVVKGWYARPNVTAPQPTARHFALLAELLAPIGTGGNLVSDAHLAALSIEHGAELCSFDRDFSRFSGVRWLEPQ